MWSRSELKTRAKEVLKLNYWKAVLVSLILAFISGGSSGGSSASGSYSGSTTGTGSSGSYEGIFSSSESLIGFFTAISIALVIFLIIFAVALVLSVFVFNPLIVGCRRFFINCSKGTASLDDITYAFSHSYLNVVKIMFFMNLYIFLWSLLLIVPGIIKGLEYRMIPYLLAENPALSKEEAFALTRQMMDGDKWNAFVLDLSFIGWALLGVLTCCILNLLYVDPYINLTDAELYAALKRKIGGTPWERRSQTSDTWEQPQSDNPYLAN